MTREEYLNQRENLVTEAQNHITEGNAAKSTEVQAKITELDEQYKNEAEAQANLNALKDNAPSNIMVSDAQNVVPMGAGLIPVNFNNADTEEEAKNAMDEKTYVNAWAKDMMNKPLSENEMAIFNAKNTFTHTTENTGILIPETVVDGIWREIGEVYPLWNDVYKSSVKGSISLLKAETSPDVEWYEENQETESGELTFSKETLNGCELSRSIRISWKLKEMAIPEFVAFIQSELAKKIGKALGYGVAVGKGNPSEGDTFKAEPRGVITALKADTKKSQIITYSDANPIGYTTFTQFMSKIKSGYKKGAKIYANNDTIWNVIANVLDGNGRPYFIADSINSGGAGRILSMIVEEDDSIPTGIILGGNAKEGYHANINKEVVLDSEEYKKKRQTEYLAYGIVDGDVRTLNAWAMIAPEQQSLTDSKKGKAKDESKEV